MEKLKAVKGNEQHPELVIEWLKEQGATDYNEVGGNWGGYYYFVAPSNKVMAVDIESRILELVDFEVVELEQQEQPEHPKYQFEPFDKVLVRDKDDETWHINHFSHIENAFKYRFACEYGDWSQCIPYNKGNKHLVGTTNKPKEGETL